jgi:hypothetical protein
MSSTYIVGTTNNPTPGFVTVQPGGSTTTTTVTTSNSTYPVCSPGTYWQPASSMCISGSPSSSSTTTTVTTSGSCPSGTTWNGVGCSSNGGLGNCAAGSYWNGNSCITPSSGLGSLCPDSQYWNGARCSNLVGTGSQTCNEGYYFFLPSKSCLVQM